ncbi:hypothetical protein AB0L97_37900, partial [Nocardia sp. NPDC051911]
TQQSSRYTDEPVKVQRQATWPISFGNSGQQSLSAINFTAAYISIHQAIHGHSPNWAQIAEAATDQNGLRLFLDADDATAQSRWIATHGWIVLRDGSLQPGKRVAAEARSRGHSMPGRPLT